MKNEQLSMMDILIETHVRLERQGPGSSEMTEIESGVEASYYVN